MTKLRTILLDFLRFITFRRPLGNVGADWRAYLAVGLVITAIVGIGRSWDDPAATLFDLSGIGSILYVFGLAGILWITGVPIRPERWTYRSVLLMVTMTALPGITYAVPVERMLSAETARSTNLLFLAGVAIWRVSLLGFFLRTVARLPPWAATVVMFLPLALIVAPLSLLGVLSAIMSGMSGVRTEGPMGLSGDVLLFLAAASWISLPLLIGGYIALVVKRNRPPPRDPPAASGHIADT